MNRTLNIAALLWVGIVIATVRLTLAQTPPGCIGCSFDTSVATEVRVITAYCSALDPSNPYGKFIDHCDRYQCSNGAYYLRRPADWPEWGCYSSYHYVACPGNTCP